MAVVSRVARRKDPSTQSPRFRRSVSQVRGSSRAVWGHLQEAAASTELGAEAVAAEAVAAEAVAAAAEAVAAAEGAAAAAGADRGCLETGRWSESREEKSKSW
jgi:hypothetical protein